jgi:CRISPR system Cascade subunit CasA
LFIKRNRIKGLCPHCAALALFCLQTNAPAGGAGIRTGLRGGGPLTTLLVSQHPACLWRDLWLNICERDKFLGRAGDPGKKEPHFTFPWLAEIDGIQAVSGQTAPIQVHPFHIFWAMPRRIRLDMENLVPGDCDLCGRPSPGLIRRFFTRPRGLNYKGAWRHPLSPYYENKGEWLAMHPQPGGIGYRHWLPWVLGVNARSRNIQPARVLSYRTSPPDSRLWAFGFDMDNMKARCWYEATLPLYGLSDCDEDACRRLQAQVEYWLAGADLAVFFLRTAVKNAWFDEARGDFSMVDASFWSRTETDFYAQLKTLIEELAVNREAELDASMQAIRIDWHKKLVSACLDLFDNVFVGTGRIDRQNPRRIAQAYQQLKRSLDGRKIRQAVGRPLPETPVGKRGAKKSAEIATS